MNNFPLLRLGFAGLVLLSHAPELVDGNRERELLFRATGVLSFGEFAVDGFFLISGYLITSSWLGSTSARSYLLKRLLRIVPGFAVAYLVSLLVFGGIAGGDLSALAGDAGKIAVLRLLLLRGPQLDGAFAGLPNPQINSAMWTIAYEFRCYLLVMLFGGLGLVKRRWLFVAVTGGLLGFLLSGADLAVGMPQAMEAVVGAVASDVRFAGIFCVGGVYRLFRDEIRLDGRLAIGAALVAALALRSPLLAEPVLAVFGGYALFWLALHAPVFGGVLVREGVDISYGLYLYGWPVQNLLIWFWRDVSPWVLFPVSLVGAGLLGAASWFIIERPAMRLREGRR